jgi:hypothetical protein
MKSWMKNIVLHLMVYVGIVLIACGPSMSEKENGKFTGEDSTLSQKKRIDMESDFLSDKNKKAFEQRAIQKLEDLKDYFEILSNSKIDSAFRNQAIAMALALFASNENTISLNLFENNEIPVQKVGSFFISLQNDGNGLLSFEIHDVTVVNRIKQLNDSEYEGAIKFKLFVLTKQENSEKVNHKMDMQCKIIAKKIQKEFGKESKQVWEVFLGDIFQIP